MTPAAASITACCCRRSAGWKNNLSVLTNYTLSKCMSIRRRRRSPGRPSSIRTTGSRLLLLLVGSPARVQRPAAVCVGQVGSGVVKAVSHWQFSPLVRWQSGNRAIVTTGVDNALTGMGGQRAVQILDDPHGDGTPATT